jgi:hypothetical protein
MLRNTKLATVSIDPYTGNIYDPTIISDVKWTGGSNTLFIIVGDLVDGNRPGTGMVDDPRGSFELLLLCFLYNLRLSARTQSSEVLYTIGNHDYHTVISEDTRYDTYIHDTAKKFFTDNQTFLFSKKTVSRKTALRPFYLANPFYIISFMNGTKKEMACVHGGFQNTKTNFTGAIEAFQSTIDKNPSITYKNILQIPPELVEEGADGGIIWSRYYSEQTGGVCDTLGTDYPFVVIGHCPTHQSNRTVQLLKDNEGSKYEGCSISDPNEWENPAAWDKVGSKKREKGIGCVVTDCNTSDGPRLAFVDTAMSDAFRYPTVAGELLKLNNTNRYAQFLKITHIPITSLRYYNKIESVTSDSAATTRILYTSPTTGGHRQTRNKRRNQRKRTLKQ